MEACDAEAKKWAAHNGWEASEAVRWKEALNKLIRAHNSQAGIINQLSDALQLQVNAGAEMTRALEKLQDHVQEVHEEHASWQEEVGSTTEALQRKVAELSDEVVTLQQHVDLQRQALQQHNVRLGDLDDLSTRLADATL